MALLVLPLYGGIGSPEYSNAIQPAPVKTRKVIVSTNMAEQEGLIDGIVFVVDAGFVKINVFNPLTATEHLIRVPISKKNSEARSRICGFTRPGKCYHLYTAQDLESLENLAIPAIQR
jgi:HrpA-like RNA helicase